ncbi:MAG: hypothetical protein WCJ72_06025 [Chryseobacterium sp.]
MKTRIFILMIFCFILSFGQNRKGEFQLQKNSNSHILYVAFSKNANAVDIINYTQSKNPAFKEFVRANEISFVNNLGFSDRKLNEMIESSKQNKNSGESIEKLRRIFKVETSIKNK